jgi:tetratricopeptide (TPR) repeat protein
LVLTSDLSAAFKYLAEGMVAPSFSGRDALTGEDIDSRDYLGVDDRILIVAFWATWSERSVELLDDLAAFARDERYARLDIVGINVESSVLSEAGRSRILEFLQERDLPFPAIIDDKLEVFAEFGVIAVPSLAFLDDQGTLLYGPGGYSNSVRDRSIDSVETWLGLREPSKFTARPIYVPNNEASRQYNLARQLVLRGMPERSLQHLDNAAGADPQFAAVEILRGDALLEMEQVEDAISAYERATALDESLVVAWAGLGGALRWSGDSAGAEAALVRAVELDSAYTPALVDLARVRLYAGDTEAAESLLTSAHALAPYDAELNFLLGEIRESQGFVRGALEAYETSLRQLFPVRWDPRRSKH